MLIQVVLLLSVFIGLSEFFALLKLAVSFILLKLVEISVLLELTKSVAPIAQASKIE